jgi:hypothetical protein
MQPMSWFDLRRRRPGRGGKGVAYVGNNPAQLHGTLVIVDVADPKHPKQLASVGDADGHAFAQGARGQRHHG